MSKLGRIKDVIVVSLSKIALISPRRPIVVGPIARDPLVIAPSEPIQIGPAPPVVIRPSLIIGSGPREAPPIVSAARAEVVIEPAKPQVVEAPPRSYWDERGWTRSGRNGSREYQGMYRIVDRQTGEGLAFAGRIEENRRIAVPYILNPPPQCKRHNKWICFKPKRKGVYRIEWRRPARHPDEAILYVEQVLDESVNKGRK